MNDKFIYFFDVYTTIDDKTKRLGWYNERRICSVKIKTNTLLSGHQRRVNTFTKITASLSVGRVSKVVTNAFRSSPIYIVCQTHLHLVIFKEQL